MRLMRGVQLVLRRSFVVALQVRGFFLIGLRLLSERPRQ